MVLFVRGLNTKNVWIKGGSWLNKSAMCEMENVLPTALWLFLFVAMKRKRNEQVER